jgi:hypothetical protein
MKVEKIRYEEESYHEQKQQKFIGGYLFGSGV